MRSLGCGASTGRSSKARTPLVHRVVRSAWLVDLPIERRRRRGDRRRCPARRDRRDTPRALKAIGRPPRSRLVESVASPLYRHRPVLARHLVQFEDGSVRSYALSDAMA
jgi:hypothetical protein